MRRWFAILLLALLPLQSSWAAVAAYCAHGTGPHDRHLGHHEHRHAAQPGADRQDPVAEQAAASGFHFDCGHCHGACAGMPAPSAQIAPLSLGSPLAAPIEGIVRTLAQSPPERPQWRLLA